MGDRKLLPVTSSDSGEGLLRLVLPPTGSVLFRLGPQGIGQDWDGLEVRVGRRSGLKRCSPEKFFLDFPHYSYRGGKEVLVPHVGLGLKLGLIWGAGRKGRVCGNSFDFQGPTMEGQKSVIDLLQQGAANPVDVPRLTGSAVDERGQPIRKGCLILSEPESRGEPSFQGDVIWTDDQGRFTGYGWERGLDDRLTLYHPLPGQLPFDWPLVRRSVRIKQSRISLEGLRFRRLPIFCAGRVVDERGRPFGGCRLDFHVKNEVGDWGDLDNHFVRTQADGSFVARAAIPRQPLQVAFYYPEGYARCDPKSVLWGKRDCHLVYPRLVELTGGFVPISIKGISVSYRPVSGPCHELGLSFGTRYYPKEGRHLCKVVPGKYKVLVRLRKHLLHAIPSLEVSPIPLSPHPGLADINLTPWVRSIRLRFQFPDGPSRFKRVTLDDGSSAWTSHTSLSGELDIHVVTDQETIKVSKQGYKAVDVPLIGEDLEVVMRKQR